jgi:hypothetical protein
MDEIKSSFSNMKSKEQLEKVQNETENSPYNEFEFLSYF